MASYPVNVNSQESVGKPMGNPKEDVITSFISIIFVVVLATLYSKSLPVAGLIIDDLLQIGLNGSVVRSLCY